MATAKIETTDTPKIYEALLKVQAGLANIPKNGKMRFGATQYDYLRADDVQERLNPLLTENGIIVKADYTVDTLNRGRGEGSPFVYVNLILTYVHTEDGSTHQVSGVGESAASDDKSINKALTQAIKNVHRTTFQFASGEPEPDDKAPTNSDAPQRDTTPRAVKTAGKAPAGPRKPAAGANKARVKAYIDAGVITPEEANELVAATGLKGEEAYGAVADDLDKGEVK